MRTNISKEEALSLLQHAKAEPLGLLVYASEAQPFIQALYRAKREDPTLQNLQIRQTPEGIAICHDPTSPYPEQLAALASQAPQGVDNDDQTDDPGDKEISPIPV